MQCRCEELTLFGKAAELRAALKRSAVAVIAAATFMLNIAAADVIDPADIRSADEAYRLKEWNEARTAYATLVNKAPWRGAYWRRLAEACAALGDVSAAEQAYLQMRETGYEASLAAFEIAAIDVKRGDIERAAEWLETALREGLNNVAFRLRVDPRFAPAFENAAFAQAYARIKEIVSADNPYQKRWMAMRYLTTPEVLRAIGAITDAKRVRVTATAENGRVMTKTLTPAPYTEGRFTRAVSSLDVKRIPGAPALRPLYLQRAEEPFFMHWDAAERILYVQINTLLNDGERTVEAFGREIAEAIRNDQPRAVVIDLRWNSGGDSGFNKHIVNAVAGSSVDAPGKLFTIIGRRTFSAAINLTSALKAYSHAMLVGEPSGSSPNFIGETNAVFLPNTGMIVSVSNRRRQGVLSDRKDRWWTPDLPAEPNWNDYRAGVDPAMRTIEQYLDMAASE